MNDFYWFALVAAVTFLLISAGLLLLQKACVIEREDLRDEEAHVERMASGFYKG